VLILSKTIDVDASQHPELSSMFERIDQVMETDPQEAVQLLSRALLLALPLDDQALFSALYSRLGSSNLVLLNPVSIRNYEAALDAAEQCQRLDLKVDALHGLGLTFLRFEEFHTALDYCERSMQLARAENYVSKFPKILIAIALVLTRTQQYQRSVVFTREASETAVLLGDRAEQANALNVWADNLIIWYIEVQEQSGIQHTEYLDEAIELAMESRRLAQEIGAVRTELMVAETLAHAMEYRGRCVEAKAYLEETQQRLNKYGFAKEVLDTQLRLGALLLRLGNLDESIALLQKTRREALKLSNYQPLPDLLKSLCTAFEMKEDFRSALAVMKEIHLTVSKQRDQRSQISAQIFAAKMDLERAQQEAEAHKTRVSQLEDFNRSLQVQAHEDPLTGLPNRRALEESLGRRLGAPVVTMAFVMGDIDFFKKVNDEFSHLIGDEVLRHVGKLIRDCLRPNDLASRIGGEEFAILLDQCKEDRMVDTCDRIRRMIERYDWDRVAPSLRVTMSFGTTYFQVGDSLTSMMTRADSALYAAKHNGRNRVEAG
jgi:diguanylate cyclase (GGDEF)-like protein